MSKTSNRNKKYRSIRSGAVIAITLMAILVLAIGIATNALASTHSNTIGTAPTTQTYWTKPDKAFYAKHIVQTSSQPFYIGDTVVMPNGLQIKVTKVQRQWQPLTAVSTSASHSPDGDDPTGRETVLIWFQATNVGKSNIGYSDSIFTLQVPGKQEQRVARLTTLKPTDYGAYGISPWLLPGDSTDTFVPFLVTPDTALTSFQYYLVPVTSGSSAISRLSILLQAPAGHQPQTFIFKGDLTTSVG